jgi:hypothetical protein
MSAEESRTENREAPAQKKQRLKLIDIYTNRGAFSGDELKGIADRVREITLPKTSSQSPSDIEGLATLGERSGEPSGELSGELSGDVDSREKIYYLNNTESFENHRPALSSTGPFTYPPDNPPDSSPHVTPNASPNTLSHVSPDSSPHTTSYKLPATPLTENQAILYFCLKHLNGTTTNLSRISQATTISEHTLKSCLKKLRQEGLIHHKGRQQFQGLTGFSAVVVHHNISLHGDGSRLSRRLQQINYDILPLTAQLTPITADPASTAIPHPTIHPTLHSTIHPTTHPTIHPTDEASCSSSNKELLLQNLILEDAFKDLNPRSLHLYLEHFETGEDLQNFLDMANACILAAKEGRSKPIQNPHGFLFAQLRAGYINPPEGYKSRRLRAQELRNQQLEEELATLRRLKEREQELTFELFVAQLTSEDLARLEREAQAQIQPHIGLSPTFQIQMHKDALLKQWFTQRQHTSQEPTGNT